MESPVVMGTVSEIPGLAVPSLGVFVPLRPAAEEGGAEVAAFEPPQERRQAQSPKIDSVRTRERLKLAEAKLTNKSQKTPRGRTRQVGPYSGTNFNQYITPCTRHVQS